LLSSNRLTLCSDKIIKEVPTYKLISQSVLIDRMKINGSLARKAMRHLEKEGLIKKVVHHNAQWVYSELFILDQRTRC
jgi:small subunit ribosomal protein S25e